MAKKYIESQKSFEDSVNDHYDELQIINKEQEKLAYKQMEDDYFNQLEYEAKKVNQI